MILPRVKIVGERGSWVARAGSEELAVIHYHYLHGMHEYRDPMRGVKLDGSKYRRFVEALSSSDRCIVSKDRLEDGTFVREGYVGVFRYTDLNILPDGAITLRLVERVADPAPY